jgi:hypothetical protein
MVVVYTVLSAIAAVGTVSGWILHEIRLARRDRDEFVLLHDLHDGGEAKLAADTLVQIRRYEQPRPWFRRRP